MNSRFDNNETSVIWEQIALDVKTGVEFLRKEMGVRRVILAGLGNAVGLLRGLNPAVDADDDPRNTRPDLDPYNPANGYAPRGTSTYSEEFKSKYFAAQAARMNRLIAGAAAKITSGGRGRFPDDDVMLVARARGGRLASLDPTIEPGLKEPRKILKINGSIANERVNNQQPFMPGNDRSGATFAGASLLTLRSFLSTNAIRATNSMTGVDWCSSNTSTPCAVQQISVPLLVTGMQGGSPIADAEFLFTLATTKDKDLIIVEGASHNIVPCTECERRKGEYDNTVKNFFDYVRKWIDARF